MPLALLRVAGIALFLSGLCPGLVAAQTTGTLAGTVAAEGGITLPGAVVTVIGTTPALRRETTTDEQGSFLFSDLPPARYSVTALATGFTITRAVEVTLIGGQTRRVVIEMRVTGVTETVTVSADRGRASTAPSMLALTPLCEPMLTWPAFNGARIAPAHGAVFSVRFMNPMQFGPSSVMPRECAVDASRD